MTSDLNKGITSITYNHLNLPVKVQWTSTKKIEYLYNAAGVKVQKKVTDGANIKTTDYLDGFQYNNQLLEFFPHTEGYVKVTPMSANPTNPGYMYNYVFNYTDHLGNVRVSYTKDPQTGNLKILDESHYYPFGLKHQQYAVLGLVESANQVIVAPIANNPFKYKYNGKEFQDELGLGLYDYGARNYDPALGRWMNIDPLAEKYSHMSPYNYVGNTPTLFVDYNGEDYGLYFDFTKGTVTVKATYYTLSSDKGEAEAAKNNIESLNGQFSFNFTDENGIDQSFSINFEISIEEVTVEEGQDPKSAVSTAANKDKSGEANIFAVFPNESFGKDENGKVSNYNKLLVAERRRNTDTGTHEMGHTLGMPHTEDGYMTESSAHPNRRSVFTTENISDVFKTMNTSVKNPTGVKNRKNSGVGRATIHIIGGYNPRAPKTEKGHKRLNNGTVKPTSN